MGLRVVELEAQIDRAYEQMLTALAEWSGARGEPWKREAREEGETFARRDDVHLFAYRDPKYISVGATLTARDQDLVHIDVRRGAGGDKKRAVLVADDDDSNFVMVSLDELRRQGIREPFRKLANTPNVKRAVVSGREYVLIGPLSEAHIGDALLSLASLAPAFERHVDRIGVLAAQSDSRDDADIYAISSRVASAHRVHAKVVEYLFQKFRAAGFQVADLSSGAARADFAVAGPDGAIAFEIRPDATLGDFLKAIGQLMLIAPAGGAFRRALVLPAPRDAMGPAIAPLETAFREVGIWVLLYDFDGGSVNVWSQSAPPDLPPHLRALFD